MKLLTLLGALWLGWWLTPDQQGARLFARGEFAEAATHFHDPLWQGAAWYRAGEFERAAQAFARVESSDALYDQGNAWLMRGKYERAIACYDRALAARPGWIEALENRALAVARGARVAQEGAEAGDQRIGADAIVFDKQRSDSGQATDAIGGALPADAEIQALWLRRVQTRPADFLRAKFAQQAAAAPTGTVP